MDRDNRNTGKGSSRLRTSPGSGLPGGVQAERQGLVGSWVLAEGQGWGQPGHAHPLTSPRASESSAPPRHLCLVLSSSDLSQDRSSTRPEGGWACVTSSQLTSLVTRIYTHGADRLSTPCLPTPCRDALVSTGATCAVPLSSATKAHVPGSPAPFPPPHRCPRLPGTLHCALM